jgi:hypothetical protein
MLTEHVFKQRKSDIGLQFVYITKDIHYISRNCLIKYPIISGKRQIFKRYSHLKRCLHSTVMHYSFTLLALTVLTAVIFR